MTGPNQGQGGYGPQGAGPYQQPGNPYGMDPHQQGAPKELPRRSRRRGRRVALTVILSVVGLCLLICAGTVVYAYTQIGPGIRDGVSNLTSTEVARQLNAVGPAEAGTYVISAQDLTAALSTQLAGESANVQGAEVTIQPDGIVITVDLGAETVGVRSGVVAENGEIRLTDPQTDAGFLGNVIPDDWVAGGLEDGLNSYFAANGLEVTGVELAEGEARITTVERT
ncbi:MAG TPA: hypothetical protein VGT61_02395 [Thermomicrobiales bacterium]|jgi:hypothetical protein|nr:hypothetical protein [Thermomicrobiales bacterium]